MKRTTIFIPEQLERDLSLYAQREGRPVAAVVREAVERYLAHASSPGHVPSFAGVGASGRRDIAERHETLLFEGLEPHGAQAIPSEPSHAPAKRGNRPRRRARTSRTP